MELTQEEIEIVLEHRAKVEASEVLRVKRMSCKHKWYVEASSSRCDLLRCELCGESKFTDE